MFGISVHLHVYLNICINIVSLKIYSFKLKLHYTLYCFQAFRDDFSENNSQFEQFNDAIHELIKRKENTRIHTHAKYVN